MALIVLFSGSLSTSLPPLGWDYRAGEMVHLADLNMDLASCHCNLTVWHKATENISSEAAASARP